LHEVCREELPPIQALLTLTHTELRLIWERCGLSGRRSPRKQVLARQLAWRLQARTHGDIDAETRRLLKVAVRDARAPSCESRRRTRRRAKRKKRAVLKPGTKLVRKWRGQNHEVIVLEDRKRFLYRSDVYESLTKIAEEITSAHWSGPRFFGLDRVQGVS